MSWYEIARREIYKNTYLVEADNEDDAVEELENMDDDYLEDSLIGSEIESMEIDEDNVVEVECNGDWEPLED